MQLSFRPRALAGVAVLALTLSALPADAATARASGNVPVRLGPGSNYPVIANLIDQEHVEVIRCTRQENWCYVEGTSTGWVRGSYLIGSPAKSAVTPPEFNNFIPFGLGPFGHHHHDDDSGD